MLAPTGCPAPPPQPGLSKVYSHVLGFNGNEFYFHHWPEIIGMTFDQARFDAVAAMQRFAAAVLATTTSLPI